MEKRTAQEKEKYQPSYDTTILSEVSIQLLSNPTAMKCSYAKLVQAVGDICFKNVIALEMTSPPTSSMC